MADYYLIVKTGDAEIRALENIEKSVLNKVIPIIELTRGRKLPSREKDPEKKKQELPRYPYINRLERIKDIFDGQKIIFDLTSDESLSSEEIKTLYSPEGGYQNWIDLIKEINEEGRFSELIPCIVINAEDENLDENMAAEVESMSTVFNALAYRGDIYDDNCYYDIEIIKQHLNGKKLFVIIDCSYVIQASIQEYIEKVQARVSNLKRVVPEGTCIIVSATSFPRNIGEIGNEDYDEFKLSEVVISRELAKIGVDVEYSDYGSINPIRNDTIIMAHGWVPRIDVPLNDLVFYYRERRKDKNEDYINVYPRVAKKVVQDLKFPKDMDLNWGIRQIRSSANGGSPGSSPSFWISVRMCIHVEQQVKRLTGS